MSVATPHLYNNFGDNIDIELQLLKDIYNQLLPHVIMQTMWLGAIETHMLRHLLILTFIIVPFIAISQNSEINYKNQLKLSASRTINILNPGVEISYERLYGNKLSTQFLAGIATNVIGNPFERLRGYNIALEEKYFISKKNKSWEYLSAALNHSDIKYQERTSGVDTITNLTIVDSFTIARKTTSLAFKYGIQYYNRRFVLDINLGAGVKYRTVQHYDRTFEYQGPREPFDLHRADNVERTGFAFHFPLNIQLGYRF